VLGDAGHFPASAGIVRKRDGGVDEVMYLEGSDQHRGLVPVFAARILRHAFCAPFDVVLTHGFHARREGPQDVEVARQPDLPAGRDQVVGADILRLWAASVDYSDDQRIGPEILKSVSDNYRKLRNSLALDARHARPSAARAAQRRLAPRAARAPDAASPEPARLDCAQGIRRLRVTPRSSAALASFMNVDLSAFLLRHPQGRPLYCDAPSSKTRREASAERRSPEARTRSEVMHTSAKSTSAELGGRQLGIVDVDARARFEQRSRCSLAPRSRPSPSARGWRPMGESAIGPMLRARLARPVDDDPS